MIHKSFYIYPVNLFSMDSETTILDSELISEEFDPRDYMASGGARFGNYLLDILIFYVIMFLVVFAFISAGKSIPESELALRVPGILLLFLYYFVFEATLGKTPAKFITRTRVVDDKGNRPSTGSILGRSLSRFVPFDAFSFLGGAARGWHDRWPNTYVIDERKLAALKGTGS